MIEEDDNFVEDVEEFQRSSNPKPKKTEANDDITVVNQGGDSVAEAKEDYLRNAKGPIHVELVDNGNDFIVIGSTFDRDELITSAKQCYNRADDPRLKHSILVTACAAFGVDTAAISAQDDSAVSDILDEAAEVNKDLSTNGPTVAIAGDNTDAVFDWSKNGLQPASDPQLDAKSHFDMAEVADE